MPNLNLMYSWGIRTCNAPNVGYSREYRDAQTVPALVGDGSGLVTYYDCSSFVWYALKNGGFDVVSANNGETWPMTTVNEPDVLTNLGFIELPIDTTEWLAGDIVMYHNSGEDGHTAIVYRGSDRVCMGAEGRVYRNAHVPLQNQVCIGNKNGNVEPTWHTFRRLFRYGAGGATPELKWVVYPDQPYRYLNEEEMTNNAHCFAGYFLSKGWTVNAIAGWLGCIEWESTIHPASIEAGYPQYTPEEKGIGLVQWTPDDGYGGHPNPLELGFRVLGYTDKPFMQQYYDGTKQCDVIQAEYDQYTGAKHYGMGFEGQWAEYFPSVPAEYKVKWNDYIKLTDKDAEFMVKTWLYCYGRGATDTLHVAQRVESAKKWYEVIKNDSPYLPPQVEDKQKKHGMPIWMYTRPHF